MSEWLKTEYEAYCSSSRKDNRYALYRVEPEYIYLRSYLFNRKCGAGESHAGRFEWLRHTRGASVRAGASTSSSAIIPPSILRSVGFTDYCLTMERPV